MIAGGFYGFHLLGYTDRIPGVCAVATEFFQFNGLPIFPCRSAIVIDEARPSDVFGVTLPLSFKSVVLGYVRGWIGAVAMMSTGMSLAMATVWLGWESKSFLAFLAWMVAFFIGFVAALFAVASRRIAALCAAGGLAFLLATLGVIVMNKAATHLEWAARSRELALLPVIPVAISAMAIARLTRIGGRASPGRAHELLTLLHFPPAEIETILVGDLTVTDADGWVWPRSAPIEGPSNEALKWLS